MTQEERTLLHTDLSERVPYDTVLKVKGLVTSNEEFGDAYLDTVSWYEEVSVRDGSRVSYDIADVRPYLRPMETMTEEECDMVEVILGDENIFDFMRNGDIILKEGNFTQVMLSRLHDYFNLIHVDYRGLIPKGLALEAPEGMYK